MILITECIIGCLIFVANIVRFVLKNRTFGVHAYEKAMQARFLELHLEYKQADKKESIINLVVKKLIVSMFIYHIAHDNGVHSRNKDVS